MIAAALVLTLAMGPWIVETMPDLRVGPPRPLGGTPVVNWRHTDLDADGKADLVFAGRAAIQRDGRFPAEGFVELPSHADAIALDLWDGAVYFRLLNRLAVYRWNGQSWDLAFSQDMIWPDLDGDYEVSAALRRQGAAQFESFLFDLDGDNYPEIVVADRHGLYCFRREGDAFVEVGAWAVFPTLHMAMNRMQEVWPPENRRLMLPVRQMNCTVLVEADQLSVVHREFGAGARYIRQEYQLSGLAEEGVTATAGAVIRSARVPGHVKPFRLNNDERMDFAGGRWELSQTSAIPTPIFETWASIDGGATFVVKRTACIQSFRPHCSFIDFDRDGLVDLVTEGVNWTGGGPRETLNQIMMAKSLPHVIRVYRQEAGGFSEEPVYTAEIALELDAPLIRGGARLSQYQAGELVNITGDFNGDGVRDLSIRTSPTTIQIVPTLRKDHVFAPGWNEAITVENVPAASAMRIADVDQNGSSDLVLQSVAPSGGEEPQTQVYFAPAGRSAP